MLPDSTLISFFNYLQKKKLLDSSDLKKFTNMYEDFSSSLSKNVKDNKFVWQNKEDTYLDDTLLECMGFYLENNAKIHSVDLTGIDARIGVNDSTLASFLLKLINSKHINKIDLSNSGLSISEAINPSIVSAVNRGKKISLPLPSNEKSSGHEQCLQSISSTQIISTQVTSTQVTEEVGMSNSLLKAIFKNDTDFKGHIEFPGNEENPVILVHNLNFTSPKLIDKFFAQLNKIKPKEKLMCRFINCNFGPRDEEWAERRNVFIKVFHVAEAAYVVFQGTYFDLEEIEKIKTAFEENKNLKCLQLSSIHDNNLLKNPKEKQAAANIYKFIAEKSKIRLETQGMPELTEIEVGVMGEPDPEKATNAMKIDPMERKKAEVNKKYKREKYALENMEIDPSESTSTEITNSGEEKPEDLKEKPEKDFSPAFEAAGKQKKEDKKKGSLYDEDGPPKLMPIKKLSLLNTRGPLLGNAVKTNPAIAALLGEPISSVPLPLAPVKRSAPPVKTTEGMARLLNMSDSPIFSNTSFQHPLGRQAEKGLQETAAPAFVQIEGKKKSAEGKLAEKDAADKVDPSKSKPAEEEFSPPNSPSSP